MDEWENHDHGSLEFKKEDIDMHRIEESLDLRRESVMFFASQT